MTRRTRATPSPLTSRFAALALALVVGLLAAACGATTPAAPPAGSGGASSPVAALPLEVDVAGAVALHDAGAFVLDVREPDEWAAGHIEGATLISLGDLAKRTPDVPQGRDVVVVCRSGNRSAQGRDILLQAGFDRVTSMAGGMGAWVAAGQPVVTGP
jgi:rhodanese-related sulfurtransferase